MEWHNFDPIEAGSERNSRLSVRPGGPQISEVQSEVSSQWSFTPVSTAATTPNWMQLNSDYVLLVRITYCSLDLPTLSPATVNQLDSAQVLEALAQVDEVYQAPVALFYLEDCSYKEIADILEVPIGTVKSRMSRGIAQLQEILTRGERQGEREKQND